MRPQSLRILLVLSTLLAFAQIPSGPSFGQGCLLADFDDDGDPWTLQTTLPYQVPMDTLKLILEVPADPPLDRHFWIDVIEGCCNDNDYNAHYGVRVDPSTMAFYSEFVDWHQESIPTCTYCCPWIIELHIRADAPLVPGQRYFIAQAMAGVECTEADPPCGPPHDIVFSYHLVDGNECTSGEAGLLMACPPTAEQPASWGRVRSLYR